MGEKIKKFNKIVFLEKIPIFKDQIEVLKTFAHEVIIPKNHPKDYEDGLNRIQGAEAIVTGWFSIKEELIKQNPKIKFIGFWATVMRIDNDLKKRIKYKIFLHIVENYEDNALVEYILGGMICLKNLTFFENEDIKQGKETQFYQFRKGKEIENFQDGLLDGKEALIIGQTNSSKMLADILSKKFNMKVTILECPIKKEIKEKFHKLLKTCNFLIINNHHLEEYILKGHEFALMKNDVILVNTTTGQHVIRHKALIDKCKSSPNFRVLMDAYSTYIPDPEMFKIRNIWMTDRRRFTCKEVFRQKTDSLIEGFKKYFSII